MEELKQLIIKRKNYAEAVKENKFGVNSLLAGLYNDPSHFIYELLQNAEDAKAKEVRFELFEDRLDVYHDGIDFNFNDIDGVTGIGISTKQDDLNSIGKFGVGFKSVFAITKTPFIYSGKYNIMIDDFVVPVVVERIQAVKRTKIVLPFNHERRSPKEVYELVSNKLESIGLKTLLFLRNIEEIKWKRPDAEGHYLKENEEKQRVKNTRKITIISNITTEEYLVIDRPIKIENQVLKAEVAYRLGKDKENKEIIVSDTDSKLIVFFPTERPTAFNFLIQGPYRTTPNRESIPMGDTQNKLIIEETGKLIAESIQTIKELGYLNVDFLNVLPIEPENKTDEIYSLIYEHVKRKFLENEDLLPGNDRGFVNIADAVLARGKGLTEFLSTEDLKQLFSKRKWLSPSITYDQTRGLRDYLVNELAIKEIDFQNFAEAITGDFLKTKPDSWLVDFYRKLFGQEALWRKGGLYSWQKPGILRTKPILRLENGDHMAPFDSNNVKQVYLPSESSSKFKTIKKVLAHDEESLKFFKELGLTEPDIFSEIKEFILPKYSTQPSDIKKDEYLADFKKILTAYINVSSVGKEEFIGQFSEIPIVLSIDYVSGQEQYKKPSQVYLNDQKLKEYFAQGDSIYFASELLYNSDLEQKTLTLFLQEVGVNNKPSRIEVEPTLTYQEKELLRKNTSVWKKSWDRVKDYTIEGLVRFLSNPSKIQSIALWNIFVNAPASYFQGEYEWTYYSNTRKENFVAQFVKVLRQKNWLYDKDGNLHKPSDITLNCLSDEYAGVSSDATLLVTLLEFKPEIIDQLPRADREKLELLRDFSLEELTTMLEKFKKPQESNEEDVVTDDSDTWKPQVLPEEAQVHAEDVDPETIISEDLKGQSSSLSSSDDHNTEEDKQKELTGDSEEIKDKTRKAIGNWGEKYVLKALREKFRGGNKIEETGFGFKVLMKDNEAVEVVWLNKHNNVGKGHDFIVKKNNIEIEYIEVKTKQQDKEELIEITGTQWEFARALFNQGEGNKYFIYVVLNAGTSDTKIKIINNPIKLWKEGKLYAHPVKFKL
jgi:hypothetical protein